MSTDLAKYRLVPALTTTGQATRVRGCCRRFCCGGRGMRGHSRHLACRPEGMLETARAQEDRSQSARVGCVLHSTPALTSASAPKGVLSKPCEPPGTTFGSAFVPPAVVTFASLSVRFWGPPELGVMFGIERRPASPVRTTRTRNCQARLNTARRPWISKASSVWEG